MNSKILLTCALLIFVLPYFGKCQNVTSSDDVFTCLDGDRSCSSYGHCNSNSTACICDDDHATYSCDINIQCCYKRKSQTTILILQAIPPTGWLGIGLFILGQPIYGIIIIALLTGGFCGICLIACSCALVCNNNKVSDDTFAYSSNSSGKNCFLCTYCLMVIGVFILWIWSIVVIGKCTLLDGNGIKMNCNV
jgi:hypothetical protein